MSTRNISLGGWGV